MFKFHLFSIGFLLLCMPYLAKGQPKSVYCGSKSDFPWHEWIAQIQIGKEIKKSDKSTFSDFTSSFFDLKKNKKDSILLTSGFSWATFDEYWSVWIDYNQNGIFETETETAFKGILTRPKDGITSKVLKAEINVPQFALTGTTRMRISMKRKAYSSPCENLDFGEVEDFSVIIDGKTKEKPAEKPINATSTANLSKEKPKTDIKQPDPERDLFIFPDINTKKLTLVFPEDFIGKKVEISLQNAQGLVISKESIKVSDSRNQIFDLSKKPAGKYVFLVKCDGLRTISSVYKHQI
jgi:hypothetical protein